jgi:hypothetical protein
MSGEQLLAQVAALTARVIALEETVKDKRGIPGPRGPRGDIGLGQEETKRIVQETVVQRLDEYVRRANAQVQRANDHVQRASDHADRARGVVDNAQKDLRANFENIVAALFVKLCAEYQICDRSGQPIKYE